MKVTILQWNIWTNEKPENILTLINEIKPDIVCLQELTQNFASTGFVDMPVYLASNLDCNYYYARAHSWPTEKGIKTQGNGIFTKFQFITNRTQFVQENPEGSHGYANEGRVVAMAEIDINGQKLTIATTHLSYSDRLIETPEKIAEEKNLLNILGNIKNNLVIAGDFNVDEESQLITQMEKKYKNAGPSYEQKTWTTKPFHYHDFHAAELNWRLDYVFTSKDVRVTKSEIIKTDFSDHLPILVEIEVHE